MVMDCNWRLIFRVTVIVWTLHGSLTMPEATSNSPKQVITEQYAKLNRITNEDTGDEGDMTSRRVTNEQTFAIFTMTFTSRNIYGSNTKKVNNINTPETPLEDNGKFNSSYFEPDSANQTSNVTERSESYVQGSQSTEIFKMSGSTSDLFVKMYRATDRGMQSITGLQTALAGKAEKTVPPNSNFSVTETSFFSSQDSNVVTPQSFVYSNISAVEALVTSTSTFDYQVTSEMNGITSMFSNDHFSITSKPDICHQYGGCDLVPGPIWFCHCDDLCEEYDDCCRDYVFSKKNRKHNYTCVDIEDNVSNIWGIQAISNCPENYTNTSTVLQCSRSSFTSVGPPVLDLQDKSRVYRNKYCAICNGANAVQLGIAFTISPILFQEIGNAINLTDDDFQDYLFRMASYRFLIPENANVRYCLANLVRNDNNACNLYSNPILIKEENHRMYRNVFCGEGLGTSSSVCAYNFMESSIAILLRSTVLSAMKLTILFSFSQNNAIPTVDPCREWSKQNDESCAHLIKYINAFLDCDFNIQFPHNTTTFEIMQSILLTLFVKQLDGFITVGRPTMVLVNDDLSLVHVQVGCNIQKQVFSHEFSEIKRKINHQRIDISEENSVNDRWLISNKPLDLKTNDLVINDNLRPLREFVSKKRNYYMQYGIHLPDMVWSELCDDVKMMVMRFNNGSLKIITVTCQSKPPEQQNTGVLATLTLVFTSVSCASLVVMIVINRLLHLHHEAVFANLEIIGVTIILSNIFLLIGQTAPYINSWVCYTISVLSHYLWLAVFSFKSLAVMHIVVVLMKLKERRMHTKESNYRKRRKLVGIGLIIPLLFVAPSIFVDQHGPLYFSPGYVNEAICFPIKFPGNLIFFTGPVLAMVVINAACIIQIMIRVHLANVAAINIRQSPTFSEAKIFLRLLSISGGLWITGIMAAYFKSEWLEYVFTVLCGLQGLFVAIANLTTKRIDCFRGVNVHTNET